MCALQKDGQNWWKIQPRYSNEVLIGNWLEERRRFTKDSGKLGSSIYKTDFIWFPDHKPDQTLRRTMMEKFEGLPVQHFFTHHDEPRSRNLVSEYDDKYNRHGYNPVLLPLHSRNEYKFAWIPKKADYPILEPPTNYGLLEHLMKKWHKKEYGVMNSVYTTSYESPPISAFATRQLGQAATTHVLPSNQGHLPQNISRILDYEGCQKYLQVIRQLVRDRKARDASVNRLGLAFQLKDIDDSDVCVEQQWHLLAKGFFTNWETSKNVCRRGTRPSAGRRNQKAALLMKSFRDARALIIR